MPPKVILVLGECGDGKSTLVDALRDERVSDAPPVGLNPQGVTKNCLIYPGEINGEVFHFVDTPGIGDNDVTPVKLFTLIEAFLESGAIPGGIYGVVVTMPVPNCRVKLGARIVKILIDLGFTGADKYARVILAGTKCDKADEYDKQSFMWGLNDHASVKEAFFPGSGACVLVNKNDYSELKTALAKLPPGAVGYKKPQAAIVAETLAEKLGLPKEEMLSETVMMRDTIDKHKEEIQKLLRDQLKAREEVHQSYLKMDSQVEAAKVDMAENRAAQARDLERLKERAQRLREDAKLGQGDGSPEQKLKAAQREVAESLRMGFDELEESGRCLGKGTKETQISKVQRCISAAMTDFKNSDNQAQSWARDAQLQLQNTVERRRRVEERQQNLEAMARECRELISAKRNRTDAVGKEVKKLEKQLQEQRDEAEEARNTAKSEQFKRDALTRSGSCAMVFGGIGAIYAGTAWAIAETAVKKAIQCAEGKAKIADLNAMVLEQRKQHEQQLLRMEEERGAEAQKQLDQVVTATKAAKEEEKKVMSMISRVQVGVEGINGLWRVAKDAFSRAEAAHEISKGPAFRLTLLKGPMEAISKVEGFERLAKHPVLAPDFNCPSLLESIPLRLKEHCPDAKLQIDIKALVC